MTPNLKQQEKSWLEKFFSGRNALSWEEICNHTAPSHWLEQVQPWIDAFNAHSDESVAIVLPVFDTEGPCQWYGMASDAKSAVMLSQELTALIGPSYSDFSGLSINLSTVDPIENALIDRFGTFVFRLNPFSTKLRIDITHALQLYLSLRKQRPPIPDRTQRPFGKIRADFDRALLAGNEIDALQHREEIVATGRLNAEQQKYLEIRMLAGLGRQQQLAHDYTLIRSVLELSPPTQILSDIIEALYATFIVTVEFGNNLEETLSAFRKNILHGFGPLFRERKGLRSEEVLKAFLLYELAQDHPDIIRCNDIIDNYPIDGLGREIALNWRASLVTEIPISKSSDLRESTNKALGDENYEAALELCLSALPAQFAYSGLLRCAVELGDDQSTSQVLEVIAQAPNSVRNSWNKRDLSRIAQLQNLPYIGAPRIRPEADWMSWIEYVKAGNFDHPPLQILDGAVARWSVGSYASDPQLCKNLAISIGNAGTEAEQIFRTAFVHFAEFFADRQAQPVRSFIPIYIMLLNAIAWNGAVSRNELELASILMEALINTGPDREDYIESIDAFSEILAANNAPNNIDWSLNAAEMMAVHSSPDKESRLRFFVSVVEEMRGHAHRLNSIQRSVLQLLAVDYSCPELLNAFPPPNEPETQLETEKQSNFSGLIGIYSLTEKATQRAQNFLRKLLPNARVEINSDMASTDRLKHLSANADIFVFAWKSSKHQAFYAAKDARGSKEILLPLGKGTASILECVLESLRRNF
jgi:hypothetical protein